MALEGGMKCVKFLVFFFNFIFWVCGVALIAIGIYALLALGRAPVASLGGSGGSPAAIVVLGVIIFFTSFFGCCGAWRESYCMVTTFVILLSLIFLVEVAAAIAGYVFKDKVHGLVEEGMKEAMRRYGEDSALRAAMDTFQREFSCCGVDNFTDWGSLEPFSSNGSVPTSCCRREGPGCNLRPSPATVFDRGCLPSLEAWLKKNILVLAAVALGIAFLEILGIVFSCCLMRGIRSGYEVM